MQYDEEEVTIEGVKEACEKHFLSPFECKGLSCDVLAGEQGPSCHSMKHIPDLKVIHIRLIKSSSTSDTPVEEECALSSPRQQYFSAPPTPPRQNCQYKTVKAQSTGSPNAKGTVPKSLSVSQMIKLGKLVNPNASTCVLEIYLCHLENISWSLLPQKMEFVIEKDVLGKGSFREAFKARSSSTGFSSVTWVVKRYLPRVCKEIVNDLNQTMEQHTKKVVQMHALVKNFAGQLIKKVEECKVSTEFGETLKFKDIYFAKLDNECLTLEEFIEGKFEK